MDSTDNAAFPAPGDNAGSVSAVVIRADGKRFDLGVIAKTGKNRREQVWWNLVGRRLAARRIAKFNREQRKHA